MSVDTCRGIISRFYSETEEHRQVLQDTSKVDTSKVAAKSALASLKAQMDKIDNDKLKTVNTTALPQLIARWTGVMCEVLNPHRQDHDWSRPLALFLGN